MLPCFRRASVRKFPLSSCRVLSAIGTARKAVYPALETGCCTSADNLGKVRTLLADEIIA